MRSALVLLPVLILLGACTDRALVSANELRLGKSVADEVVEIPLQPMLELDYLSRESVLNMRKKLVDEKNSLLARPYSPESVIFSQIVSGKPWWGIIGCSVYGQGQRSIEGLSEESRFLLNPYLLVGVSSWSNEIWDLDKIQRNPKVLLQPDFPYCWQPSILRYYPARSALQVAYEVSSYNQALTKFKNYLKPGEVVDRFNLVAYNARDFGFNYLYVPVEECKNIENAEKVAAPVQIVQFIHCGGSSGYNGGCNNMSPLQKEINEFYVKALPATVKVKLWRSHPGNISRDPDCTVFIELR
ncbi:MAG: hypothetical protein R3D26_11895 [Cyanobacteriota/Melainabacteria group bacterium]